MFHAARFLLPRRLGHLVIDFLIVFGSKDSCKSYGLVFDASPINYAKSFCCGPARHVACVLACRLAVQCCTGFSLKRGQLATERFHFTTIAKLPDSLVTGLTVHRTVCLQAALSGNPEVEHFLNGRAFEEAGSSRTKKLNNTDTTTDAATTKPRDLGSTARSL